MDAELLQGVSLRTVASRHGLSASALHRHRAAHVDAPTVGDLLEPDDYGRSWCRWDGTAWQPSPMPRPQDLVELRGRPEKYRVAFWLDAHGAYTRRTYRLRKSRSRTSQ